MPLDHRRASPVATVARFATGAPATRILRFAMVGALLTVAACGPQGEAADGAVADVAPAAARRDTALLSAQTLALGGFDTARVERRGWRDGWTGPAQLVLDPTATDPLGSIVEGRVGRALVQPGDLVRRGQLLVTLHSHEMMDARAMLATAEAGLTRARTGLTLASAASDRADRLFAARALSQAELERAHATRDDAHATMRQAEAEQSRAADFLQHLLGDGPVPAGVTDHEVLVRAPFDGVVVALAAQPGQVVTVGAPLVTVSRTAGLVLVAQLPETRVADVAVGAPLDFTVAAAPGRRFTARVARIAPTLDSLTRTVEIRATVAGGDVLRPGMFATAELLGPRGSPVLTVPAAAVQSLSGDTVVVVYERRGDGALIEAVPVRVGRRTSDRVELLGGPPEGARVVTTGSAIAKAELLKWRDRAGAP